MEATCRDEDFDHWIDRWILSVKDHDDYLARLGAKRLLYLRGKAQADSWKAETATKCQNVDFSRPPNILEKMTVGGKPGDCRTLSGQRV